MKSLPYVVVNQEGMLLRYGFSMEDTLQAQASEPGEQVFELEFDPKTQYLRMTDQGPQAMPRGPFSGTWSKTSLLADGVDTARLGPLETGSRVFVSGPIEYDCTVDDGWLDLVTTVRGEYQVEVRSPTQLPFWSLLYAS